MAKKNLKPTVHTTQYIIFDFGENINLITTSDGLLIPAPKIYDNNTGEKTVVSLPDGVILKKHDVLFEKVLFNFHPVFCTNDAKLMVNTYGTDIFNVEKLAEQACASVGGYNFVGGAGQDFDDIENSDLKTVSVNPNTGVAELASISAKIGTLRIMIYNPFVQDIHYFYMTFEQWTAIATKCYSDGNGDMRLRFQYSADGHYNQFEKFRVDNFVTLATKMTLKPGWNTPVPSQC